MRLSICWAVFCMCTLSSLALRRQWKSPTQPQFLGRETVVFASALPRTCSLIGLFTSWFCYVNTGGALKKRTSMDPIEADSSYFVRITHCSIHWIFNTARSQCQIVGSDFENFTQIRIILQKRRRFGNQVVLQRLADEGRSNSEEKMG